MRWGCPPWGGGIVVFPEFGPIQILTSRQLFPYTRTSIRPWFVSFFINAGTLVYPIWCPPLVSESAIWGFVGHRCPDAAAPSRIANSFCSMIGLAVEAFMCGTSPLNLSEGIKIRQCPILDRYSESVDSEASFLGFFSRHPIPRVFENGR